MKKFQCPSRRETPKMPILVCVLLVCSLQFVTSVLEVNAVTVSVNPTLASVTILNTDPVDTVVATFTVTGTNSCPLTLRDTGWNFNVGYSNSPDATKDGATIDTRTLQSYFAVGGSGNTLTLKTKSTAIPTGTYVVHLDFANSLPNLGNAGSGCLTQKSLTVTVDPENQAPRFAGDSTTRTVEQSGNTDVGAPVTATDPDGDTVTYSLGGTEAYQFNINSNTGQLRTGPVAPVLGDYSVTVTATDGTLSDTITVDITVTTGDQTPGGRTLGPETVPQIAPGETETPPQIAPVEAKTPVGGIPHRCPLGWQRQDTFGQPTPKVFIRAVDIEIDRNRRAGLYTPVAIEIYADPAEGLRDLAGWKLTVGTLYNPGREYPLTAENAVFNKDGIARIVSPADNPFPMLAMGYTGRELPNFDYRLFSEKNRRVDFGIACYKRTKATRQHLEALEKPRVVRNVDIPNIEWDRLHFLRSEWSVPGVETVPAAPRLSNPQHRLTTTWGALKKR